MTLSSAGVALGVLLALAVGASAQVLPGQLVRDPDHPQWLMRAGGEHVFLSGPGDPESFFFRGTRLPDGTRDGDQDEMIDLLIEHGGNGIYVEAVRSHGGDGPGDHNPFVDSNKDLGLDADILDQWEDWLTRLDDADITVFFLVYDDGARPWNTGDTISPPEHALFTELVNRFEHHRNIAFFVSEESEESMSHAKARALAQLLADADDHGHLIGGHHHSGTVFKSYEDDSAFNLFAMHLNVSGDAIHTGAAEAFGLGVAAGAAGHGYLTVYTECLVTKNGSTELRRHYTWDAALAGIQALVYGMNIHDTPIEQLQQCRILQEFMESTAFWTMSSSDARAAGATRWVLADDDRSAILYTREPLGELGLAGMSAGTIDLLWVDCVSGARQAEERVIVAGGENSFARPAGFGAEVAVSISPSWDDLGHALGGLTESLSPRLCVDGTLVGGEPVTLRAIQAEANAPGTLVLGFDAIFGPLKGGVLVPSPDLLVPLAADAAGELNLSGNWPVGAPADLPIVLQVWFVDSAGPRGFAATNGVRETTP